jgi:hypothetical protein
MAFILSKVRYVSGNMSPTSAARSTQGGRKEILPATAAGLGKVASLNYAPGNKKQKDDSTVLSHLHIPCTSKWPYSEALKVNTGRFD